MKTAELPVKLFATITYIVMVTVNYLANALPLNGRQTGEVSDNYENLFAPAGLTFSIWGLIYLLLALHLLHQWGLFHRAGANNGPLLRKVAVLFAASSLANTAWVFAWHYDFILVSTVLIATILVLLAVIAVTLRDYPLTGPEYWLIRLPFSIYFGWITVATVANITVWLVSIGWDGFGIEAQYWAVAIIAIAALIGTLIAVRNRDVAYVAVLLWAFTGILIKHNSPDGFAGQYPAVITTTIVCLVAFVIAEIFIVSRLRAHPKP
jgi:hypothetical protein